ncbi:helix-turn-helix transcriptional regulator [Nocardioides limicola]|uniref:helix-turn-helix transcriptional regulator n=1 Tax=Nocardioides limicola TaxID=2803368 RepID=UPI00193B876D|nr:LuxR family transcriptional regulator [Nocardioides sp. DJM-14]
MVSPEAGVDLADARAAYQRRDWVAARDAYQRAHSLTPLDLDDLYAAGNCHWWLGELPASVPLLQEAYRQAAATAQPGPAGRIALDIAYTLQMIDESAQASGWMSRAYRCAGEDPEDAVNGYLRYIEFESALGGNELEQAATLARSIQTAGDRHREPTLAALGVLAEGRVLIRRGELGRGLALLDEAMVAALSDDLPPDWAGNIYCNLMAVCEEIADLQRAGEWTAATARWCDSMPAGSGPFMGICRVHRAHLHYLQGDWSKAEREARLVIDRDHAFVVSIVAEAHYLLGELSRQRGDLAGADREFTAAHALGRDPQPGVALLQADRGDTARANVSIGSALESCSGDAAARGRLLSAAVEIALAADDLGAARGFSDELAAVAVAFPTPGFEAASAYALGLVRLAEDEGAAALPLFRQALQSWQSVKARARVEQARLGLARSYELVGDPEAAGRERAAARVLHHELGDPSAQDGAPLPGGLTPREAEVVCLVAGGRSNQEIADVLVLSVRTVERHLAMVYQKLGVSGRSARAAAASFAHREGLIETR